MDLVAIETRIALHMSIDKWKANTQIAKLEDARVACSDCPLCNLFILNTTDARCDGCPVFECTAEGACRKTPYTDAFAAHKNGNLDDFLIHAQREVEFLQSLLENPTS